MVDSVGIIFVADGLEQIEARVRGGQQRARLVIQGADGAFPFSLGIAFGCQEDVAVLALTASETSS